MPPRSLSGIRDARDRTFAAQNIRAGVGYGTGAATYLSYSVRTSVGVVSASRP
jgi:hypothetical protein